MPKQFKIGLAHERYSDIPEVIEKIREITGTVTNAQIAADALRERLAKLEKQKKRDAQANS